MTKHTLYFELDFNGKADDLLVKLKVKQSKSSLDIKFRTRNLVSCEIDETSLGGTVPTSPIPLPSTSDSVAIPVQDASASASEVSAAVASDAVSDGELTTLAAQVPHDKYHDLSDKLGINYNEASRILKQHGSNYEGAMRKCLSIWKNKSGGSFAKLKSIFYSVQLGGIWMELMRQI